MKTVRDLPVEGRRVLVRVDLNVPLRRRPDHGRHAHPGVTPDDSLSARARGGGDRLLAPGPAEGRAAAGQVCSLRPVAERMSELLGEPVAFDGKEGPVRLLENLRFDPREEKNDPALARRAGVAGGRLRERCVRNRAHRAHASTAGVAHLLPSAAGLLLASELEAFDRILEKPEHPFVVVIGGAKVADKIGVIDRFTGLADAVLVGGAMAFTFLAARGIAVGASKHEDADGPGGGPAGDGRCRRARLRAGAAQRRRHRRAGRG